MSQFITLENDIEAGLVKDALQQYVTYVNDSEDHTDMDGTVISIARDLPVIERVISMLTHASDRPLTDVLLSAIDLEGVEASEVLTQVRTTLSDGEILAELDNTEIETYYDENIKVVEPPVEPVV